MSTNAGFKTFTLQSGEGAASGVFDGDLGGVTSATVAVYPAAAAKDDATVTLPAEYAWAEGQSNAVMFCDKVSLTEVNSFKHLGGILKIAYAGIPADADALVLKAEAKITGDFAIADGVIAAGAGTDEVKVTFAASTSRSRRVNTSSPSNCRRPARPSKGRRRPRPTPSRSPASP